MLGLLRFLFYVFDAPMHSKEEQSVKYMLTSERVEAKFIALILTLTDNKRIKGLTSDISYVSRYPNKAEV